MHIATGLFFILHGIAHLAGFVVPWRIIESEEMPYRTTILAGAVDLGDAGIRVLGVFWLLGAVAFAVAGIGAILQTPWWNTFSLAVAVASLALSILGWPQARIGVYLNLAILGFLILGGRYSWFPEPPS